MSEAQDDIAATAACISGTHSPATPHAVSESYRGLFDSLLEGVAYCRMIFEDGVPVDWIYLDVNPAFYRLTGLDEIVGRRVTDAIPGIRESNPELFELYGTVAKSGVPARFDIRFHPFNADLHIEVTRPADGHFLAVFEDITNRMESEKALLDSYARLERMTRDVVEAMGRIVETRDPYTQGHEQRVARLCTQIANEMDLADEDVQAVATAALLHDIGKLCVPVEILTKPGLLSPVEFSLVKEHSEQGYEILKDISFPWPIARIVLQHHERMDGSGYPGALMGDEILLAARILAVADVVEAMSSHRPYRPAVGVESAIAEIADNPDLYDGAAAAACLSLYAKGLIDL